MNLQKDIDRLGSWARKWDMRVQPVKCNIYLFLMVLFPPKCMINVMTDFDSFFFLFLDGDVSQRPSYGAYISQLKRFDKVCCHVEDFNARNKCLTAKLLKQGYRYHKLRKAFFKFYRRHYELISKFNVGLKSLLHQGLSEQEFYGDKIQKEYG